MFSRSALNLPNALTMTRLVATPGLCYLIYTDRYVEAIGGCFLAGVLDYFDGYFARRWNQRTVLGSFIDPLADKVFVGMIVGTLVYKAQFPSALFALIIGRDAALLGGSFAYRYMTKPPGVDFFATEGRGTIHVEPTAISRYNTVLQMSLLGFSLTRAAWGIPPDPVFTGMCWVVAGTTFASGVSYLDLKALRSGGSAASLHNNTK